MTEYKMTEKHLRDEIVEFLKEQDVCLFFDDFSTALLCLIAANDPYYYSFSDDMINDLPQFIPTEAEIKKFGKPPLF